MGEQFSGEQSSTIEKFFSNLSAQDQDTIDADILNPHGISLDVLKNLEDDNVARSIMSRFRIYLAAKEKGESKEALQAEAKDLVEYIDRQFDTPEEPARKAA